MAIDVLSPTGGDLISRADAIEQMAQAECGVSYEKCIKDGCDCPYVGRIKRLPSADRPHGVWIDVNGDGTAFKCDQCGAIACCDDNYCPNCGARMKGGEDE